MKITVKMEEKDFSACYGAIDVCEQLLANSDNLPINDADNVYLKDTIWHLHRVIKVLQKCENSMEDCPICFETGVKPCEC